MRMEISTTTHLIICKTIIPIGQLYTMKMAIKTAVKTSAMTTMKATATTKMKPMNRQKRNKRLGVACTMVLIVVRNN